MKKNLRTIILVGIIIILLIILGYMVYIKQNNTQNDISLEETVKNESVIEKSEEPEGLKEFRQKNGLENDEKYMSKEERKAKDEEEKRKLIEQMEKRN